MPSPLRAEAVDPRLQNYWRLEIAGINIASIQEVDMPDLEIAQSEFSDGRVMVKVNGLAKYGDLTLRKVLTEAAADLAIFAWFTQAFDPTTGRMGRPSKVKRNGDLIHVDGDGNEIERYKIGGMLPKKKPGQKLTKKDSAVLMEEATFSVDSFVQTPIA